MNESMTIHAKYREHTGKKNIKKLKQDGFIPAVVYGHNFASTNLSLNALATNKLFRPGSEIVEDYRLCKLVVDNKADMKDTMVIVKDIQRHPISEEVEHIDFFAVRMDEKIVAPVHIRLHGKPVGVKLGGILRQILREVEVKSLPANIPPHFDIDVSSMNIGDAIHVSELQVPDSVQVLTDQQAAIVNILAPSVHKDEEQEEAEAAADAEAEKEPEEQA